MLINANDGDDDNEQNTDDDADAADDDDDSEQDTDDDDGNAQDTVGELEGRPLLLPPAALLPSKSPSPSNYTIATATVPLPCTLVPWLHYHGATATLSL